MHEVLLNTGQKIPYELRRRANTRSVRVSVFPGGEVRVTAPVLLPTLFISRFLRGKGEWILKEQARMHDVPKRKTKAEARGAYLANKESARALILERLQYFNKHYGYLYQRISIRDQHSRWGSCSRKGNLNFNYRLLFIPSALSDYVIVHELCHLKEFNHSKKFWALVGECIPDYDALRKRLQQHQHVSNTKTSLV